MPRVTFVKSARKDNPVAKKGESYYWWKFRYGGKRYSLTRPKPSQLTQSPYYSAIRGMVEYIDGFGSITNIDDLETLRDEMTGQLEELRDETQESLDNMPESLQCSPTGELLQERIDALESALSDVEDLDDSDTNWSEVAEQQEEHQEWEDSPPDKETFKTAEEFEEAYEDWGLSEPVVDDLDDFDLYLMSDPISNAEV